MAPVVNRWRKRAEHKLDRLSFNKSVTSDFSNFVFMNTSQSEELRYFVFHYRAAFFNRKQAQNDDQFTEHF